MPQETFDISQLYEAVFRQSRNVAIGVPTVPIVGPAFPYKQPPGVPEVKPGAAFPKAVSDGSQEGTEFINMRDTIQASLHTGVKAFMPIQIGSLVLPNEPTIEIFSRKRIQETEITGNTTRKGTVKELISTGDYDITIRGIALNYQSVIYYPEDIVKALNDLYLQNQSHEIKCALTQILGVYELVIRSIRLPHTPGKHAQAYELVCVSDEPFELDIDA
jgi:hypothetical protein